MSRLEDFIRDNREEFDSEEPRPQLWKNMRAELEHHEKRNDKIFHLSFLRWTAAAAIVIMILGMFYYMNRPQPVNDLANNTQVQYDKELDKINPTYASKCTMFRN